MTLRQTFLIVQYISLFALLILCSCTKSEDELAYRPPSGDHETRSSNASQGQTVYVPAYSHIYHQDGRPHPLTITLSIRNTSRHSEIVVDSVAYHDSKGKKLKSYLNSPLHLKPLATTAFLVERDDVSGGVGASFIIEWTSEGTTTPPVIESVMIDTSGQQGLSFARAGIEISERSKIE